jgi:hypothetical protein
MENEKPVMRKEREWFWNLMRIFGVPNAAARWS